MERLYLDIETYSPVDIGRSGVYRYSEDPSFRILLFGYAVDDGDVNVIDLAAGEEIPDAIIEAIRDENVIKWAHNASFERVCLSRYLRLPAHEYLPPESWRCSMVWSAYLGLPLSLKDIGRVLRLEEQKIDEGRKLIRLFCSPTIPSAKNVYFQRNLPEFFPEEWKRFIEYNRRDVEVEIAIAKKLSPFPVPDFIWDEYHLSERINDRGVLIDTAFARKAIELDDAAKREIVSRMQVITGLENPGSVQQLKAWLRENNVDIESLGKKEVKALLDKVPTELKEVLELRLKQSKSSVKKYQAMVNAACSDDRARGMFMFGGASRTLRFSGRLIQLQNLPQNHIEKLAEARDDVMKLDYGTLSSIYDDIPDTLSQLIRTAFIPEPGYRFIASDFSAIEARVLSWLAGEEWRMEVFRENGDIYSATASKMFGVPVAKHGLNAELRQKGKQAELACIAEGELVLTDCGLIPIEEIQLYHKLWNGEEWVSHDGVVFKGEKEVIEYEGLRATPDHLVWIEGKQIPVRFGDAATSGTHLIQTGYGRKAIRLGENNISGKEMEQSDESLLCTDQMSGVREHPMAESVKSEIWEIKGLPAVLSAEAGSSVAVQKTECGKAKMREPEVTAVPSVWCERNPLPVSFCDGSRIIPDEAVRNTSERAGGGSHKHEWELRAGESEIRDKAGEPGKQKEHDSFGVPAEILAIHRKCCKEKTGSWNEPHGHHSCCSAGCSGEKKMLENHISKTRLYDIRNAGRHHRFTVSGKLVHNCGYGGSKGALIAMGALDMGMKEDELQPLVDSWREANPHIVKLWNDVGRAAVKAVREKGCAETHGLVFTYEKGFLFVRLPSGRRLAYVKPRIEKDEYGRENITYEGTGQTKKWERIRTFGGKQVENIVQAIARDILCFAMRNLSDYRIVMHIHDEVVIEAPSSVSVKEITEKMSLTPPWAEGLVLNADGYECGFYRKD